MGKSAQTLPACACATAAFTQAEVSLVLSKQTAESDSFCLDGGVDDVIVFTFFSV